MSSRFWHRLRETWLPRVCFVLTFAAGLLVLLWLLVAPLFDGSDERPIGEARLVAMFARDVVVRRTALVCGLGLLVTAAVFFRRPRFGPLRLLSGRRGSWFNSQPPDNIGA